MKIGAFKNQSDAYRAAREELLAAEIALKNQREAVAAMRRALPGDTAVEDYVFQTGPKDLKANEPVVDVRLSDLFDDPAKPLLLQHVMFGKAQNAPCPMCALWTDGYNGIAHHIAQRVNFAALAAADVADVRALSRERGWSDIRLLSAGTSTIKADFGFETPEGNQHPGMSVFTKDADGNLHHFYSGAAPMSDTEYRGMDLLNPLWNLMDLTPEGRGDFFPKMDYP